MKKILTFLSFILLASNLIFAQQENSTVDSTSTLVTMEGQEAETFYNQGIEEFKTKNYPVAITSSSKAIEINPQFAKAYFNRAAVNVELNKPDVA